MSAVDEFLNYGLEKTAILGPGGEEIVSHAAQAAPGFLHEVWRGATSPDAARTLGSTLQTGAALSVLGGALGATGVAVSKLWDMAANSISKARGFEAMVKAHPDIGSMDRTKAHQLYSTLHNFNPEMARDPYIAGGWVKRTSELDYVDPHTIQALVNARTQRDPRSAMERGAPYIQAGLQASQQLQQAQQFGEQQAFRTGQAMTQAGQFERTHGLAAQQAAAQQRTQRATVETQAREHRLHRDAHDLGYQRALAREKAVGTLQGQEASLSQIDAIQQQTAQGQEFGKAYAHADPEMLSLIEGGERNRVLGTGFGRIRAEAHSPGAYDKAMGKPNKP